jgi:hypothetical protein
MNPLAVAAVWAGAGVAGAAVLPAARARRLGVLVPFAGLVALLLALVAPGVPIPAAGGPGALHLDRTTQGLLMACAISLVLMLVLAPTIEGPELLTVGLAGAATIVAVTATNPVVWALGLLGAVGVLALRWIAVAPGRATLAAGRVAVGGSAALLAAAPFLPVAEAASGSRPVLVSALLACGLAAVLGLVPLGGWAVGALGSLRGAEVAVWPLMVAPAVLLSAERIQLALPPLGSATFARIILAMGLATAVWGGFQAVRANPDRRYARVFIADLGLAAAAIGTGHPGLAQSGGLFLMLTHLVTGPLLLQRVQPATSRPRRVAWLLLSGIPPAPSFWGRFLLLEALGQVSSAVLVFALLPMGLLFLSAVLGARPARDREEEGAQSPGPRGLATRAAAWLVVAAGLALGVASQSGAALIFGGS